MNFISAKFSGQSVQINLDHVRMVDNHCGATFLTYSNGDTVLLDDEPFAKFEYVLNEMQNERLLK
jgi:hypothetical protein